MLPACHCEHRRIVDGPVGIFHKGAVPGRRSTQRKSYGFHSGAGLRSGGGGVVAVSDIRTDL